jgi:hypothetical protein
MDGGPFVADHPLGQVVKSVLVERGLWTDAVVEGATPRSVVPWGRGSARFTGGRLSAGAVTRGAGGCGGSGGQHRFARPLLELAAEARVPVTAEPP